ncbi:MAG TPA: metallophosphoesterase family protein [Vicinamibacterales bacterium]|nr:metallophosphoesterase family protein [Vicinamibacterales bacterium]
MTGPRVTVGVISDTHGLLRPEAVAALHGVDLILHAGDVGPAEILDQLRQIAPTTAVRGNVDTAIWTTALPISDVISVGGLELYMLHDRTALDLDPVAAGFAAVIFGHSHRPGAEMRDGVLHLNPGSAGPRRFTLPVTIARLTIAHGRLAHEVVELRV